MRIRILPDCNYKAIFSNGKTLRMKLDANKLFYPQLKPELEDVAINDKCFAACPYCYVSAKSVGVNFTDVERKIRDVYGRLDIKERPFQVAIGGAGEPTLHPNFESILETFSELEIVPNYTTNGMHLTQKILDYTKKYCGGVAVSYHRRITQYFYSALTRYIESDIKTSVHFIIGEPGSADEFCRLYEEVSHLNLYYFVILPYQVAGRAMKIDAEVEWIKLFGFIKSMKLKNRLAFGALFYDFFKRRPDLIEGLDLDITEPEVFSGYRIMDDTYKILRISSYNLNPKNFLITI